jgi:hypothetical protein
VASVRLFAGGALRFSYEGNALGTQARIKEQIMLSGGVMTSVAMSSRGANNRKFLSYVGGVLNGTDRVEDVDWFLALFCYGWQDNARDRGGGHRLCKNRCVGATGFVIVNLISITTI